MTIKFPRPVTKLSRMKIEELSAVDAGANQHAMILLSKSRDSGQTAIAFDPILIQKGRPSADDPDEDGDDDSIDEGDDDEDGGVANVRARQSSMQKIRERVEQRFGVRFAKARRDLTDGRSGGRSHSESDRVGVQDNRTDEEKAADLERIVEAAKQKPPLSSERFPDWLRRVYDAQPGQFYSEDLDALRKVFAALQQHAVLKRRADETLDVIAKRRQVADPSRSYFQHWRDAAQENPELYSAVRGGVERVAKMDPPGSDDWQSYYQATTIANGFGGGASASGDALDFLNREAADIQKRSVGTKKPLSKEQAFVEAAKLHPAVYAKYRGR